MRPVRDTLSLAGHEFVIESPVEALGPFRRFYPHSWQGAAAGPAEFTLALEAGRWRLRHAGGTTGWLNGALQAAFALEHEVGARLVAECVDRIALHAGGVEAGGRAHLVAGASEAGKTTSTLHLVELGHRFLCEEIALVEPGTWAVEPHLRTLAIDARFLDQLAARFPIERGDVDRLGDRLARYSPYAVCREPAPLDTLFLPRYCPGQRPRVEELDPAAVLPEVLGYCFAPNIDQEAFFDRVIRLLQSCRILRVQFDGVASARALWQRLLPRGAPS